MRFGGKHISFSLLVFAVVNRAWAAPASPRVALDSSVSSPSAETQEQSNTDAIPDAMFAETDFSFEAFAPSKPVGAIPGAPPKIKRLPPTKARPKSTISDVIIPPATGTGPTDL